MLLILQGFQFEISICIVNFQMQSSQLRQSSLNQETNSLYEQVLAKNFQIIQNFLSRFHSVFSKQEQFQLALKNIEHKLAIQRKMNEELSKQTKNNSQKLDKKINSIKSLVLENLANQKIKDEERYQKFEESTQQTKNVSNTLVQVQEQLKRMEDQLSPKCNNFEFQITCLQDRINSFTTFVNKKDSFRVDSENVNEALVKINEKIQTEIDKKIKQNNTLIEKLQKDMGQGLKNIVEQIREQIQTHKEQNHQKLKKIGFQLGQKVDKSQFSKILQQIYNYFQKTSEKSETIFANKNQTKKSLLYFEKKIKKLELMITDNDENDRQNNFMMIHGKSSSKIFSKSEISSPVGTESSVMKKFGKKKI